MGIRVVVERIALYGVSTLLFIDSLTKILPNLIPEATKELVNYFILQKHVNSSRFCSISKE
jgi:hypothetical protein